MILLIVLLLLIPLVCFITYLFEMHEWNGGICPKCGGRLEYFDSEPQDVKCYRCSAKKDYYCWICWFDPEKKRKEITSK